MSGRPAADKRVLFLVHALNLAGVSRHTMQLAEVLQARGWTIGIAARDLAPGAPMGREWFEAANVRLFQISFPGYGLTMRNLVAAAGTVRKLRQTASAFGASLIHVHAPTLCPYAGLVGWFNGIPTVSTLHLETLGPSKLRLARLGNSLLPKAFGDYSVAISTDMRRLLVESLGILDSRVRMVIHGVDAGRFHPPSGEERAAARRVYGLADADRVVCLVAVLDERKGHGLLVTALARLRERGVDVIALCAGAGEDADRERIGRLAREAGVADRVRLLGYRDSREVIWASDAAVLLSSTEGFGLVAVEAMLCGLPLLRTPSAGASDQVVDGRTGFIIPFGDDGALADRLELLFARPDLRRQVGDAAHTFATAHFTKAVMAEQTECVYRDAIDGFRRGILPYW